MAAYHPDFCYEDGSIVLLIEQTTSFRVHKSILSQHSSVFRDMLSLPSTSKNDINGGRPSVDQNLPVVELPQDDVSGFAGVLKAIYDNRFFDRYLPNMLIDQGEEAYLHLLSSIMPIARKYDFESVFDGCCVEGLRRLAPLTLPDMVKRLESLHVFAEPGEKRTSIVLMALKLADTFQLAEFYPSLFYQLIALHTPDEIYDIPTGLISWKDKTRCVMGIAELRMEQQEELRCHFPPSGDCTKLVRMEDGWTRAMCDQRPSLSPKLRRSKRVVVLERLEFVEKEPSRAVHCRDCTIRYSTEYEKNQTRIWNSLPKTFHLSKSWDDLLQGRME